jgi:hypothetical protein
MLLFSRDASDSSLLLSQHSLYLSALAEDDNFTFACYCTIQYDIVPKH